MGVIPEQDFILLSEEGIELGTFRIHRHQVITFVIIVITKYVYIFIPVIEVYTRSSFSIDSLCIAGIHRSIGTKTLVLFQFDIDNTRITGCFIFRRWIGNDFNRFDLGGLHTLQVIGQVGTGKR